MDKLCPKNVGYLNEIIKNTGAKCILSSSKRVLGINNVLERFLLPAGFNGEIIGATGETRPLRYLEIYDWLFDNKFQGRFVIIDDESCENAFSNCWVKTSMFNGGLKECHMKRAINILNGG